MKEISKKQLLNQINEAEFEKRKAGSGLYIPRGYAPWEKESQPDAREARGETRDYPKRREGAGESPDWFDREAARAYEAEMGGAPESDMMIIDDPENAGGSLVIVQRDGINITLITEEKLKDENPDFYNWATRPPNRLTFIDFKKKMGRDWFGGKRNPLPNFQAERRKQVSAVDFSTEPFLPANEKREYDEREKILREINPLIREFGFITKQKLNSAGLPEIVAPYHKFREQTENINKYTTINNNTILWSTLNIFLYDADEYIQSAKDMYRPRPNSTPPKLPKSRHAVRKDNPGRNWSITRPSEIKSQSYKENPLTPGYQLNKGGYEADNVDYMVATAFTFRGQATEDNRFVWELEFQTQYGKKLKEATRIEGGLITDETNINFVSTASTGNLEEMLGPNGSIATNDAIMDAFKEALSDITSKIESIDARKELYRRYAGVGKADTTLQLNESIDTIVSKIINELKQ
jgi:hypothetical protein